ncbi:unnamed protein product [Triticum turgidum subsp. durum]|uniref:AB hydrolase-1 domain-containing protein n=1 Tax=Triticum turgidum subsp. durum TaxID=4567 RepID=A0A9R1R2V1_TRITD|nr:unnamed protein product [Triticum turgidum subsp. durum]
MAALADLVSRPAEWPGAAMAALAAAVFAALDNCSVRVRARANVAAMICRAVRDDDINARDFTGAEETRSESDRPKPVNCAYTLRDHVEAIERSLIDPLHLGSFHLVSHSMGCTIAIALAAKHPARVKSVTLVAPPYFLPCEERASQVALRRLAEKKLWPPLLFGSAVMSWYEHIGRTICFVVCKNHRFWEWLIKIVTRTSGVDIVVRDLTRHTHHSAWHTMHNVICGGARAQDRNLEALAAAGVPVRVVHGDGDQVVPVECSSRHLKSKLPHAELRVVGGRDHRTVVFGREEELAQELRAFWSGCEKVVKMGAQEGETLKTKRPKCDAPPKKELVLAFILSLTLTLSLSIKIIGIITLAVAWVLVVREGGQEELAQELRAFWSRCEKAINWIFALLYFFI